MRVPVHHNRLDYPVDNAIVREPLGCWEESFCGMEAAEAKMRTQGKRVMNRQADGRKLVYNKRWRSSGRQNRTKHAETKREF